MHYYRVEQQFRLDKFAIVSVENLHGTDAHAECTARTKIAT